MQKTGFPISRFYMFLWGKPMVGWLDPSILGPWGTKHKLYITGCICWSSRLKKGWPVAARATPFESGRVYKFNGDHSMNIANDWFDISHYSWMFMRFVIFLVQYGAISKPLKWMAHDAWQGRPRTFCQSNDWKKLMDPSHSTCHGSTVQLVGQEVLQWTAEQRQEPGHRWISWWKTVCIDPKRSKGVMLLLHSRPNNLYEQIKWNITCLFPVNSVCQWQAICMPTSVESLADSCQDQCCTNNHSKTFPWGNAGRSNWNTCSHCFCMKGVVFYVSQLIPHTNEECPVTLQWGNMWNSCPQFFEGSDRGTPWKLSPNFVTRCILLLDPSFWDT